MVALCQRVVVGVPHWEIQVAIGPRLGLQALSKELMLSSIGNLTVRWQNTSEPDGSRGGALCNYWKMASECLKLTQKLIAQTVVVRLTATV